MSTITIHADDLLATAVKNYADQVGKSVNMAVKELLASALGLAKPNRRKPAAFMELAGCMSAAAGREIREAQADFEKIDPEMWK